jgi:Holliday junction resolvase RusA-like endonuclease
MKPVVIAIHVPGHPVPYIRPHGTTHRFNDDAYRAYMGIIKDEVEQEIALLSPAATFLLARRWEVLLTVYADTFNFDADNVAKPFLDALKGVLWEDDTMKWIKELTIRQRETQHNEEWVDATMLGWKMV